MLSKISSQKLTKVGLGYSHEKIRRKKLYHTESSHCYRTWIKGSSITLGTLLGMETDYTVKDDKSWL